ncbi:hypothetical protein AVI51_10345 [Piscirickettsia salmonis]|uniref:Protein Smg homolog n=1 Tax=Piscirickettsia salmonis TaxID=1238 RepID=A0A095BQY8_PISSA|nr:DUF494 domain-containing protein [Piscirickettsia salmonis]AKP72279.1 hypothetical protein PSLF89_66 [Piscirickettsia salmonis LF-89 = ATCC VR-1361]ALA23539.1 protein smg [Piscirickettsia salmonis]ALB24278.1 protein smg [Piscirickettsia salmonis]ALY04077.1 hypothetical protein AWE47_15400 [Piscirickettsia salmonis]AMA43631.1 hypothetical protein AWJ11_15570 [Piscirickettsia salmonis]
MIKESVLDVLMYLFDQNSETEQSLSSDQAALSAELEKAGFAKDEVERAFHWLEGLVDTSQRPKHFEPSMTTRAFAAKELSVIGSEHLSYILYLEHIGILNVELRELVIDRIMALGIDEIDLSHVKWVALMVLNNHYEDGFETEWFEEMILTDPKTEVQH